MPLKFIIPENLALNPGFEDGEGLPGSWNWGISRNAEATCALDEGIFYSGKRAVKLTNASDFAPHVYGGLQQNITVEPNTAYVLSLYARSEGQDYGWFGGGPGWTMRKAFPSGSFEWTRFELELTTGKETLWPMRIDVDGITKGLWIDDVRLVRSGTGDAADIFSSIRPFSGPPSDSSYMKISKNEFLAGESLEASFYLISSRDMGGAEMEFSILDKERKKYAEFPEQDIEVKKGENVIVLKFSTKNIAEGTYRLASVMAGKKKEEVSFSVYDAEQMKDRLLGRISELEETVSSLKALLRELENKGIDCSYQKVALTVAENFLKYASQDARKKEAKRAQDAVNEIDTMLRETKKELERAALSNYALQVVPRYQAGPIKIEGPSFIAMTKTLSGKAETRPVFFTGYGAFGQVKSDIEKFPGYGVNIIQIEFGPNSVFPSEGKVSDRAVKDFLKIADRAQANGVAVNLLLSPHYFPEWAKNKYPYLKSCSGGFLQFCIDAPESRKVLEDFIRYVIPMVKDHPALHSICISNEPVYIESRNCEFTKNMWKEWLRKKHGTIQALNKNYGTDHNSFEDVSVPDPQAKEKPVFYDWAVFNAERFAGWHRFMADIIREIAPALPVHAKIMMWGPVSDRGTIGWGIDPELFGELGQINGNDCCKWYAGNGEYRNGWQVENMGYDLQRSVADKPVFNSENHLIADRDLGYIPPAHIRNVLWQGAIRGQSATTIWVWERTYDRKSDFAGSIMHRPACAQAVGITGLDLMRLSREVTAIQNIEPQVLFLYSISSIVYSARYLPMLQKAYEALDFSGMKLGFITERQLAGNKIPKAKVIVVAGVTHLSDAAYSGLKKFAASGEKAVFMGENLLSRDEYNKERIVEINPSLKFSGAVDKKEFLSEFIGKLSEFGLERPINVVDAVTGSGVVKSVWGVEYLSAKDKDRMIINMVNYANDTKTVKVLFNNKPAQVKNLFDGKRTDVIELVPLEPVLIEIIK